MFAIKSWIRLHDNAQILLYLSFFFLRSRDIYHTCYALSGLSIAQNSPVKSIIEMKHMNRVEVIHPVYNVEYHAARKAQEYFSTLPIPD